MKMKKTNIDLPLYLSDQNVADILGISLKSLYNKVSQQDPLPVYICPPSTRVRLWPVKDFHEWLAQFRYETSQSARTQLDRIKRCKK